MEVQTAAMLEPYKGKPGVRGLENGRARGVEKVCTRLDKEGFSPPSTPSATPHPPLLDAVEAARAPTAADSRTTSRTSKIFNPATSRASRPWRGGELPAALGLRRDDYMVKAHPAFLEPERARSGSHPHRKPLQERCYRRLRQRLSVSSATTRSKSWSRRDPDGLDGEPKSLSSRGAHRPAGGPRRPSPHSTPPT